MPILNVILFLFYYIYKNFPAVQFNACSYSCKFYCCVLIESVCSWYDGRPPDVEIQNRSQNITVGQNKMVQMHCIIRNIGRDGKAEWKFNGSSIIPCIQCSIQVTTSGYDDKICGFVSTILITKLVVINQGIYTCSARQNNAKLYSSDSIHIFTNTTTTDIPTLTSISMYQL